MTPMEQRSYDGIVHVVHDYANFISSAEMVTDGRDIDGALLKPPINTHVSHAFYLNCRKLADFFENKDYQIDDILAQHYVPRFDAWLPIYNKWRDPINKQLARIRYKPKRDIDKVACEGLYKELQDTWREFRKGLVGTLYEVEFKHQIHRRKNPYPNGKLSEFRYYDLD